MPVFQEPHRVEHSHVGLAGPGGTDREGEIVFLDGLQISFLVQGLGIDRFTGDGFGYFDTVDIVVYDIFLIHFFTKLGDIDHITLANLDVVVDKLYQNLENGFQLFFLFLIVTFDMDMVTLGEDDGIVKTVEYV